MKELRSRGLLDRLPDLVRRPPSLRPLFGGCERRRLQLARELWAGAVDIRGTIAQTYLQRRGLMVPSEISCLRFHPHCPRGKERLPALIAKMTSVVGSYG
jgi:hypothetical protein